jgi:NADH pyrophosphatase NudC (nudix superfamily)
MIVSMYADYDSGSVTLCDEELVDHAWVDLEEAKAFDLIENIYEQLIEVEKKYKKE